MTKIFCDYQGGYKGTSKRPYCDQRNDDGICTKLQIHIRNGEEGYALFKPCCQHDTVTFTEEAM